MCKHLPSLVSIVVYPAEEFSVFGIVQVKHLFVCLTFEGDISVCPIKVPELYKSEYPFDEI